MTRIIDDSHGRTNTVPILEELEDPDLAGDDVPPPAYGDFHDQLQLSQAGFETNAAVTSDGRITININQKDSRLAELLGPTLRRQLVPDAAARPVSLGPLPPPYIPPSLGGAPGQTPPPRLNVVIQIVGSRGDVQPFVALGQVLRDTYGHRVRIATHPTFQGFVEENGLEFFSIGGDPAELMAFMVKNPGLMPGIDALKSGEIKKRRKGIERILMGTWRSCIEAGNGLGEGVRGEKIGAEGDGGWREGERPFVADAIIANPPSFGHVHVAEKLGIPMHMMFTMPWSPTRAFPHPLANIESSNTDVVMTNYVSYALVEMMTWQGLGDVINRFRTKVLDLEPLSLIWAPGLLSRLRIPTTYCWSPALIPKPGDWGSEVTIAGFYFLNLASSYTPDPELAAFLAAGPPPVYIGFGSIVVENPNFLTRTIFDAIAMSGVRALVSKGWGGLGADSVGIPSNVFMLGNCPHDWLFKRVSAVVHHGGAGTTAAGINNGKPTVVVPFFGDQPFWGAMIAKAGAGPAPIPFKKLNAENLATAIGEALKPETQARAEELGAKIREEQGVDVGGKSFHEFLNTDELRCSLAPSRVAVWRVRRTKLRLSALAAAVLVNEGALKYSDMKLYRAMEYNTEDQPWDPMSAVTSSLVGDLGTMAMAAADFPREIFEKRKAKANASTGDASASGETQTPGENASLATSSASASVPSLQLPQGKESPKPTRSSTGAEPSKQPSSTGASSSGQNLSTNRPPGSPSGRPTTPSSPGPNPFNLETAIEASENVSRIVGTGMKMPMNVCMGLARGFRNAPKLYNDDTVRPTEKVTGFASGLKVAGKEFGLGFYDGVSGLVTQPLKGAEKEGGRGLLKGFGKGIGGLILKPAAAIWSIPAYAMQGVHAEVRNLFARSSINYIVTSRVVQGKEDLNGATEEEKRDILARWQRRGDDLKGFYSLKQKEKSGSGLQLDGDGDEGSTATLGTEPPKTGWLHTRNLSFDDRRRLHKEKEAWKKQQRAGNPPPSPGASGSPTSAEDEEFERAIQASVKQTSRGNKDEDAQVEAAIRASLKEMRRIAEEQSREKKPEVPLPASIPGPPPLPRRNGDKDLTNVSDEEYQALVEEAVRRSLAEQQQGGVPPEYRHGVSAKFTDEELQAGLEGMSRNPQDGDDDEELHRVMEESRRAYQEELEKQKNEEDAMLEYFKKQSLAEQEFESSKGKGKAAASGEDEEIDEDLKRAMEESLKESTRGGRGEGAGPSY
ncbi:hypothetical protein B0T16DRAFT_442114 [Cercophora newfieldiana]|uniref:Glycosyltransferase family 28 N-terminal domain-containing protein n=1 Tax=Cercophora newfieldiana TaxID=92897 RepID=A0AA39YRR9_9PEZI|nr:hypothetical protein B0T16DRAFT_442114 [Cercophora newfieldiana]